MEPARSLIRAAPARIRLLVVASVHELGNRAAYAKLGGQQGDAHRGAHGQVLVAEGTGVDHVLAGEDVDAGLPLPAHLAGIGSRRGWAGSLPGRRRSLCGHIQGRLRPHPRTPNRMLCAPPLAPTT